LLRNALCARFFAPSQLELAGDPSLTIAQLSRPSFRLKPYSLSRSRINFIRLFLGFPVFEMKAAEWLEHGYF
jgi:hypothetical protein